MIGPRNTAATTGSTWPPLLKHREALQTPLCLWFLDTQLPRGLSSCAGNCSLASAAWGTSSLGRNPLLADVSRQCRCRIQQWGGTGGLSWACALSPCFQHASGMKHSRAAWKAAVSIFFLLYQNPFSLCVGGSLLLVASKPWLH